MIRILIAAAALVAALPAAASAAERRYTVTEFDRIEVDGPWKVTVVTGRSPSATATGSGGAIDRLAIDVSGRTLRVRRNASSSVRGEAGPVEIRVSTHGLRAATVKGAGAIALDKARALRFEAGVAGSGTLGIGAVDADTLVLALTGSGRITVAGKAKTLRAAISGTGDLDASALAVDDLDLTTDTAGRIALAVKRSAKVQAGGTGEVAIAGKPSCTIKTFGSASVACGAAR